VSEGSAGEHSRGHYPHEQGGFQRGAPQREVGTAR